MKVRVKVMRKHIMQAVWGNPEKCPIALALKEYLRKYGVKDVAVIQPNIFFYGSSHLVKFIARTPVEAYKFMDEFDDHGKTYLEPTVIELELEPTRRLVTTK